VSDAPGTASNMMMPAINNRIATANKIRVQLHLFANGFDGFDVSMSTDDGVISHPSAKVDFIKGS
jgi:hypothetical protein